MVGHHIFSIPPNVQMRTGLFSPLLNAKHFSRWLKIVINHTRIYEVKNTFGVIFADVCLGRNISEVHIGHICQKAAKCVRFFIFQDQSFICHLLYISLVTSATSHQLSPSPTCDSTGNIKSTV